MRKLTMWSVIGVGLAVGASGDAVALDAESGTIVQTVIRRDAVLAAIGGKGQVPWAQMPEFMLGGSIYTDPGGELAPTPDGSQLLLLVSGWTAGGEERTGIVAAELDGDESTVTHVAQTRGGWSNGGAARLLLRSIATPPPSISSGPLAGIDALVCVYRARSEGGALVATGLDLVALDLDQPPTFSLDANASPQGYVPLISVEGTLDESGDWSIRHATTFGVSPQGDVYVGPFADGSIRRYVLDDADQLVRDESFSLSNLEAGGGLSVAPDGRLFTWERGMAWREDDGSHRTIFEVSPGSGFASEFATVDSKSSVLGWTWDASGELWVGLSKAKKRSVTRTIAVVESGSQVSTGDGVTASEFLPKSLASHPDGGVFVLEQVRLLATPQSGAQDAVYLVRADASSDGGGSGGGGKGGGKGRQK